MREVLRFLFNKVFTARVLFIIVVVVIIILFFWKRGQQLPAKRGN